MDNNESDSDISDADPDAILKSMQNIDDLDAELFGGAGAKSKPQKASTGKQADKKRVSFSTAVTETEIPPKSESSSSLDYEKKSPNKEKTPQFDFDLDDPLADLLSSSDDDEFPAEVKKPPSKKQTGKQPPVSKPAAATKKPSVSEDLFGDDDDGFLLDDTPPVARKQIKKDSAGPQLSIKSLMGETPDKASSASGVTKRRTLDDFLQSPVRTTASAPLPQKKGTTGYDATFPRDKAAVDDVSFGGYQPSLSSTGNVSGNRRTSRQRATLPAFKFDDEPSAKSTTSSEQSTPEVTSNQQKDAFDFLSPAVATNNARQPQARSSPIASVRQKSTSPNISSPVSTDGSTAKPQPVEGFRPVPTTPQNVDVEFERNLRKPSPASVSASNGRPQTAPSRASSSQLPPTTVTGAQPPHQALTPQHRIAPPVYTTDVSALQLAQENRIESLKRALDDMQSRMSSEVESIKESYEARFQMLRASMREAVQVETDQEVSKQDEIKRLRSLHIDALNDCRVDYDAQVKSLREAHKNEVEAVKNATIHARNIDTMMEKLNGTTKHLQQLALKYESAYFAITQQTESLATGNQQAISGMLKELHQQHKSTNEAQMNLQQNAARLEGIVTGLSKKLEEQHYQIQMTQNQLQLTHSSLQDDRSQMLQQMNKEREHNRKTQREIVDLQEQFQHSMKESLSQILRHSDNLKLSFDRLEEERTQQVQIATKRGRDVDEMHERLSLERLDISKKQAELEAAMIRMRAEKEELQEKLIAVENDKNTLQSAKNELTRREKEAMQQHQRAVKFGLESEHAITEARQIQESHDAKMAAIHAERNEIAKQRQMLAEERRLLAKERSNFNYEHPQRLHSPLKQTMTTSTVNRAQPDNATRTPTDVLLWKHTAVQDYGYLESEKVFVESLRQSSFRKTS